MKINTLTIISLYSETPDNFLIPSREFQFGDNEIIFQDDNVTRKKGSETFLLERHITSWLRPANSPDLNPVENLLRKCLR